MSFTVGFEILFSTNLAEGKKGRVPFLLSAGIRYDLQFYRFALENRSRMML